MWLFFKFAAEKYSTSIEFDLYYMIHIKGFCANAGLIKQRTDRRSVPDVNCITFSENAPLAANRSYSAIENWEQVPMQIVCARSTKRGPAARQTVHGSE
jgi:hypothetical protein